MGVGLPALGHAGSNRELQELTLPIFVQMFLCVCFYVEFAYALSVCAWLITSSIISTFLQIRNNKRVLKGASRLNTSLPQKLTKYV